jgi:hypothetical protein
LTGRQRVTGSSPSRRVVVRCDDAGLGEGVGDPLVGAVRDPADPGPGTTRLAVGGDRGQGGVVLLVPGGGGVDHVEAGRGHSHPPGQQEIDERRSRQTRADDRLSHQELAAVIVREEEQLVPQGPDPHVDGRYPPTRSRATMSRRGSSIRVQQLTRGCPCDDVRGTPGQLILG